MIRAALLILLAGSAASGNAPRVDLKLHALFTDGMVLQRDQPCPVWGTAAPGEEVSVSIVGRTKSAKAGADGRWSVKLDPMAAGGPHELKVNGTTVRDVMVGEVWLAAGGSNMHLPLKSALIAKTEPDEGPIPMVRFFVVPRSGSPEPEKDVPVAWRTSRSETVADVSAVAYFFAREIQRRLKVPVGVLQATAENSVADMWIGKHSHQSTPGMRRATLIHRMQKENYDIAYGLYLGSLQKAAEARRKGEPAPPILPKPMPPDGTSAFYNGMIAPLLPFALKGTIFYQGEAETWKTIEYESVFPGLIQAWRADWGQGNFPFGFVQLANFGTRGEEPEETALPRFREAQARALRLPDTGMAVTVDIGDPRDLRPRNKEDVGARLALWAEARVYGKSDLVFSGPTYE